jgi:phage terminase small subunit
VAVGLTPKQENFCLAYLETGNASEAYRRAYNAENMKPDSINVNACKLLAEAKIKLRLEELRAPIIAKARLTVEDLLRELEEARRLAIDTEAPAPAVSATMGKAKLLGLDKQVIEHTGPNGGPILTREVSEMTDEELAELIANDNKG